METKKLAASRRVSMDWLGVSCLTKKEAQGHKGYGGKGYPFTLWQGSAS